MCAARRFDGHAVLDEDAVFDDDLAAAWARELESSARRPTSLPIVRCDDSGAGSRTRPCASTRHQTGRADPQSGGMKRSSLSAAQPGVDFHPREKRSSRTPQAPRTRTWKRPRRYDAVAERLTRFAAEQSAPVAGSSAMRFWPALVGQFPGLLVGLSASIGSRGGARSFASRPRAADDVPHEILALGVRDPLAGGASRLGVPGAVEEGEEHPVVVREALVARSPRRARATAGTRRSPAAVRQGTRGSADVEVDHPLVGKARLAAHLDGLLACSAADRKSRVK